MSIVYVVTGPLPVNGKHAGEEVRRDELSDPDFLEAIGYITRTTKTSAKKAQTGGDGPVESTSESKPDSDSTEEIL